MSDGFRAFSLGALLGGTPIYEFREFYEAKDALLRYDHRTRYLNYGWWGDGADTANPSAALVALVVDGLAIGPDDVVVDVGSGIGGPDVDIVRDQGPRRVVGVNRSAAQVADANAYFAEIGLADRIEHVVHDATALDELDAPGASCVLFVESLAEMADAGPILAAAARLVGPGGRLALCDVVRVDGEGVGPITRVLGWVLARTTALLYGDHWRSLDELRTLLEDAGFEVTAARRVGERVYPPTWQWARRQLGRTVRGRRGFLAVGFAVANLCSLDVLYRWGRVDYAVVRARIADG